MKLNQTQRAVDFLNDNPGCQYSPQTIKRLLILNITESALGRKLRGRAVKGDILRDHKVIESGMVPRSITVYSSSKYIGIGEPTNNGDEVHDYNPEPPDEYTPQTERNF